jgi:aldose 1-epimerase
LPLELEGGGWAATLLPGQGGAMARLAWRGAEVLAPVPPGADPNAGFHGAFVMVPWTNRLDGGRLPAAGILHRLPVNRPEEDTAIHGLARDRPWQVVSRTGASRTGASRAVLSQRLDPGPMQPWRYAARMELALSGREGAVLDLAVTNLAGHPFPFGLGWHPFFARPAGTRLRFRAAALLSRDARRLPVAAEPSAGVDGDESAYEGLDTHFAGWDGAAEILRPDGLRLRLSAAGAAARNLQVFAPRGDAVLCVEPVSHVPDAPNRPDLAPLGPMAVLAPGGTLAARIALAAATG